MKTFSFTPLLITGALVASIAGCAATAANQTEPTKAPMAMGAMDKAKMANESCACCGMHKDGMSHHMNNKPMGMMQDNSSSCQAGMCTPTKNGKENGKCGCCDMEKMGKDGSSCCGMSKADMSPDMHKKHMETK